MNPNFPSSTLPQQGAQQRPFKGAGVLDTVKVGGDTFQSVMFMGCAERREFVRDNRPGEVKPQKHDRTGVPLWSVQVAAVNWRGNPQLISVTVPMHDSPAGKFNAGDPVVLDGLVFGVTPKREGGYVTWCSADAISAAGASKLPVS